MLLEKLGTNDVNMIHDWLRYCGGRGGEGLSDVCDTAYWLRYWNTNKVDLYHLLGDTLTKSIKVSFDMSPDDMANAIREAVQLEDSPGRIFYDAFYSFAHDYSYCRTIEPKTEEACNIYDKRRYSHSDLTYLISTSCLRDNTYHGATFKIVAPNGKDLIVINEGCKVSKMLGKLAKLFNIPGYEEFRIAHSMCLNRRKLHGNLCFSIHPMDYLTMSDNDYDWSSCMSWLEGGDYRNGTVEMMNSTYVVLAYLEGDHVWHPMCHRDDITWSNKKWRQLFIVNPEMIFAIRQYPYDSPELEGACLKHLRQLAEDNMHWGPYTANVAQLKNGCANKVAEIDPDGNFYISLRMNWMYNDIHSTHPAYLSQKFPNDYHLNVSGECVCLTCGELMEYPDSSIDPSFTVCHECNDEVCCTECGDYVSYDYAVEVDGHWFCEHCYNQVVVNCHMCEEDHFDATRVYLVVNGERTDYCGEFCEGCLDDLKKMFGLKSNDDFVDLREGWRYYWGVEFGKANINDYAEVMRIFDFDQEELDEFVERVKLPLDSCPAEKKISRLDEELPF